MYAAHMTIEEELFRLRLEARTLRQGIARATRSRSSYQEKSERLKKENETLKQEINRLKELVEKTQKERDTYQKMVFKGKRKKGEAVSDTALLSEKQRTHGREQGHKGSGRTTPETVDRNAHVSLTNCPHCDNPLTPADATVSHTVTDISHWSQNQPITTAYEIERQWCSRCGKEVRGIPQGVVPFSRFGINLLTIILVWHYRFREPFEKIVERLNMEYQVSVSCGALAKMCQRTKKWLGPFADSLLEEIRGSPYKHADETGWRVGGDPSWCWALASKKSTYYTIEESRGKGVAQKLFAGAIGLLIRDDYGSYECLVWLDQQSCWAHLLRKSHEAANYPDASEEVKQLHKKLCVLFDLLVEDLVQPFVREERELLYSWYQKDIQEIIDAVYIHKDTLAIQTRVRNQGNQLLTVLLYEEGALTNNEAERVIRKIVIIRKIAGGSNSWAGAKATAVNMSVIETIVKRGEPLLDTFQNHLLDGITAIAQSKDDADKN